LEKVFDSAQDALERELAKTTLGDVLEKMKASCAKSVAK
jgi:hypothetical protein